MEKKGKVRMAVKSQCDDRLQIRIDRNLKEQAKKVYAQVGMDMTEAVRLFLRQSVIQGGLPFGMMGVDGLAETCTNTVVRETLISEGRAYEVMRTEQTCRLGREQLTG